LCHSSLLLLLLLLALLAHQVFSMLALLVYRT
jgi:hypothetical protein